MRAKYGEKLRQFLCSKTAVDLIVDLGGQKVFESATVDTCIVKFRRAAPHKQLVREVPVGADYQLDRPLPTYVRDHASLIKQEQLGGGSWTIADDTVLQLRDKIAAAGTPLKVWGVQIYRGILTGLNEAFIVDTPTKERLCREDPRSATVLRPILRGKDIKRWTYEWQGLWLIVIPSGWTDAYRKDIQAESFVAQRCSAVYHHLKSIGEAIEQGTMKVKGQGLYSRDDQGDYWWELRDCDYYDEFRKPKIMYPEFSTSASFVLDANGTYCLDTAWFISSSDLYLLGILNSDLAWWYLRQTAAQLGNVAFRMKKIYLEVLPVVVPDGPTRARIEQVVKRLTAQPSAGSTLQRSQWEAQVNAEVYRLYGLSTDEIALIKSSTAENKKMRKG
jgi:hypothetical protein